MPKAAFTGWSCVSGPAELVDYLVDDDRAEEVGHDEFARRVDLSTAPLDETRFEIPECCMTHASEPEGSSVQSQVTCGSVARIEFLFLEGGFDQEEEARLAQIWEAAQ